MGVIRWGDISSLEVTVVLSFLLYNMEEMSLNSDKKASTNCGQAVAK